MRIVCIVGMCTPDPKYISLSFWETFENSFLQEFPSASFHVTRVFYFPWQIGRIRTYMSSIQEQFDTGEDVLFIGHSLGGVIACVLAANMKKSKVLGIVTVAAPHGMSTFYRLLGGDILNAPVPIFSFGCLLSLMVPAFLSRHPRAMFHHNFFSGHTMVFVRPRCTAYIASAVRALFSELPARASQYIVPPLRA